MADKSIGYEQLGGRRLSLIDAVAQSVGFMGPVFASALILPLIVFGGFAGKGAGVATPFAVILAFIGIFALAWIIGAWARRIHAAGALYDYATAGLGDRAGYVAGWVYYWGTLALTSAIPLVLGGITYFLLHDDLGWSGTPPYWVLGLIYAALLFAVLYFGVQISTRVQLTLALVSAVVMLGFFVYIIAKGGAGGDSNSIDPFLPSSAADGWSGIMYGVLYGVLIFVGFETAANLGEETNNPKRNIPRAILLATVIVGAIYVISGYAQDVGFGLDAQAWGESVAVGPLFVLGAPDAFGSVTLNRILQLIVILDIIAVGIGAAVSTTRGIFALARDRKLPAALAAVSPKYGTPVGSILITLFFVAGTPVLVRLTDGLLPLGGGPEWFPVFNWMAGFGGFALAVVYALVAVSGMKGLWAVENRAALVIAGIIGLAVSLGALWGAIYQVPHPANKIPWGVVIVGVIGILLAFAVRGRKPASEVLPELTEGEVLVTRVSVTEVVVTEEEGGPSTS